MTFSLHSMVRLVVLLAVGSTILAVGVSRLDPPQQIRRFPRPATSVNINDFSLNLSAHQPRWIDSETGKLTTLPIQAPDVLEAASCSPWVDGAGKRQVAGRWSSRSMDGSAKMVQAFGLGRYSYPDGKLLDQIHCNTVPIGPPCWLPGMQARILFTSGDGQLYRFRFEAAEPTSTSAEEGGFGDAEPTALTWACPKPGLGDIYIGDLSWPSDARLSGRLLASMRIQQRDAAGSIEYSPMQLWSLKIDAAGTQVLDVDPLIRRDVATPRAESFDERSPVVARLPDGSLALAYTRLAEGSRNWCVCHGPLTLDVAGGLMVATESQMRVIDSHGQPAPLSFSPDGGWINVLVGRLEEAKTVLRFPTLTRSFAAAESTVRTR